MPLPPRRPLARLLQLTVLLALVLAAAPASALAAIDPVLRVAGHRSAERGQAGVVSLSVDVPPPGSGSIEGAVVTVDLPASVAAESATPVNPGGMSCTVVNPVRVTCDVGSLSTGAIRSAVINIRGGNVLATGQLTVRLDAPGDTDTTSNATTRTLDVVERRLPDLALYRDGTGSSNISTVKTHVGELHPSPDTGSIGDLVTMSNMGDGGAAAPTLDITTVGPVELRFRAGWYGTCQRISPSHVRCTQRAIGSWEEQSAPNLNFCDERVNDCWLVNLVLRPTAPGFALVRMRASAAEGDMDESNQLQVRRLLIARHARATGTGRGEKLLGSFGNDLVTAAGGDDNVNGRAGDDVLYGGAGRDILIGGAGSDTLHGGPGRDTLIGGAGNDRLDARDGARGDLVVCGAGVDTALVDAGERAHRSCERVTTAS